MNRSNNYVRTAQVTTNEIGINDQHQMNGRHQQLYSQPAVYVDDNDMEQREGLLRSLEQKPIPSVLNVKTDIQHNSSTPKRGRSLNDSGGSISSAPKQHKSSKGTRMQMEDTAVINQQQSKSLPFDQLKRAMSSNLPCFFIEFEQTITSQRPPSACEARNVIEKHFKEQ
ncbi:unnamed protein product [Rotaria sp. Silwood2]|nr:unnamed protein product [Rotaria sp. Silwood2]CAF2637371.1 unnamed protein product [Rotaria sp. Silwood2]CAF3045582.1 unnamed protein product [Rotaria sp. Silwood2]CAF3912364.1 unnamed protein product [Rotaria sp. Silwood2]CAF4136696.1 unnamed protein product [Rotaria sp. Silwood2]